jgi:hypothetical protein
MSRIRLGLIALAFIISVSAVPTVGQTVTATVVGAVRDAGGDALPGAEITVTSLTTNISRKATSDEQGNFTITYLQPGVYSVAAEASGFKRALAPRVELLVNQTTRVDLTLQPGQISDAVEVQGTGAALISADSSSVGQVIDSRQMTDLPLKGRGFYDLALLSGAVAPRMPSSFVATRRPTPGGLNAPAFSVAGAREKSNGYLIDGVDAQDPHYLTPSIIPSVDAIQEFKLETNAYSAEFGRYAAQVNATTRAGGNDFHGSLFEFLRNDAFDAANFFDNFSRRGKAPLRYNQFGGTIGGPVSLSKKYFGPANYEGRDRTFFFFNYQGTRTRRGRTAQFNVPTAEQRAGDFSRLNFRNNRPIFDPLTTRPNPSGAGFIRDPFPNNRIPEARITPFAREILKLYPLPTIDVATGNNFFTTLSDQSDHDQILGRVDHRFNERNSLFFRYALFDGIETNKSPIDQGGQSTDVRTHNIALSYLRSFGARTVYELRLGYNRPSYLILQDGAFGNNFAAQLGLKNLLSDPIGFGVPQIALTGFSGIGTDTNPTTQISNVYQIVNILSLVRGDHNLKTGADLRKINYNDRSERFVRGSFSFTGAMTANPQSRNTTGVAIADLLLGLPLTAGGSSTSLAGNFNGFSYGFFAQDDWKVSRRLTLNLGLRYELNTRFTDVQNRLTRFDPEFPGGRLLLAGTSKAYIPGRGIVDGIENSRGLIETDTNNFAPRVGLAFRPFAERRLVVRAGYGIFYDITELQDLRTWVRNPPFGEVVELAADQNANAAGAGALRVSELFPARGTPTARPNVFSLAKNTPDPYFQQWNLNIQQQLPGDTLLEVAYVGSKGTYLAQRINLNQATLDADPTRPTPILSRRPFPLFGNTIRATESAANSTYHALIVKTERRFSSGFSFLASYTFAKAIDGGSLIDDQLRDIRNARLNKGRANFDIRRRAVMSGTWELPFGPGKRHLSSGALGQIIGGWQVNAIVSMRSGFPFSVGANGDVCNCGAGGQLAQLVGDPLSGFERSRLKWFNTAAFANPAPGTFGTSGRNIIEGPGEALVDFSAFKQFSLTERANLLFRAEFFNLFNRVNFGQPGTAVGTTNYGIIQSAGDPRIVQFGLKLRF